MADDWRAAIARHAAVRAEEWATSRTRQLIDYVAHACESPIEQELLAALFRELDYTEPNNGNTFQALKSSPFLLDAALRYASVCADVAFDRYEEISITLFPQVAIGKYRADFLLVATIQQYPDEGNTVRHFLRLVIECDGHNHHDLTKEQARHDRRRDRWMQANGFAVLRFAGSEIVRDPAGCASEISRFIDRWWEQFLG